MQWQEGIVSFNNSNFVSRIILELRNIRSLIQFLTISLGWVSNWKSVCFDPCRGL